MNGEFMHKDILVHMFKPEFKTEAMLLHEALAAIYNQACSQPKECRKQFISKTQAIIFLLALLAADNAILPIVLKLL